MSDEKQFYVYEHWRSDTNECFYVGKGHGNRAWDMRRRKGHHQHIAEKLKSTGHSVDVRLFATGLGEQEALDVEVQRIAYWRANGARLANVTAGGEGVVGLRHSEQTKQLLRTRRAQQKIVCSPETREKIAAAQRGKPRGPNPLHAAAIRGRKHSPEAVAKIAAALSGHSCSERCKEVAGARYRGQQLSASHRAKLSASHVGNRPTEDTRRKMAEAQRSRWAAVPKELRIVSEKARARMSESAKARCARQVAKQ